ncbi:Serine/threonine-protein kinase D [Tritonibacter multivorans]|uniref:non-specific serine/threonine protein kinase n=2 Tax=Tritonibacter multivorans TaxID=928856 RepID=A0A0P1GG26_9RHOB|nr:serine/threonine-protein kinase [Tritonibacter multivorans]MDA7419388.1 serine/threonine-protein kinase [Tritonibacter multivorans]CUH75364.1 Serine/threonine-protein kinase D [Tritonibacter multivorans]SFD20642.1 Serine/threonine protein kinase [Tritonibacter multivorans]
MLLPKDMIAETECPGLPDGHRLLQGQYQIETGLSAGGFGRTYVARDSLDRRVVIKECLPEGLCTRDASGRCSPREGSERLFRNLLRSFLREAQLLARPNHSNIVRVHQVFRENETAYIAMDHAPGHDLHTVRAAADMCLGNQELLEITRQALCALDCLHGLSILHNDISPDNLLWHRPETKGRATGHLTLIDFGAARLLDAPRDQDPATVKDGFSAPELYDPQSPGTAASDLYALGATLELLITGTTPVPADQRAAATAKGQPDPRQSLVGSGWPQADGFLALIDTALSMDPDDRFPAASDWLLALPGASDLASAAQPSHGALSQPQNLHSRIAQLVAETNSGLTPHLPRALRPVPPQPKPKTRRGPMVDLFGNPIDDLETWLLSQEHTPRPPAPPPPRPPSTPSFTHRLDRLKARSE